MNKREKILAAVLGVALLGGVVYSAFAFVISPLFEKKKLLRDLEAEVVQRESAEMTLQLQNKRLQTEMFKRSLPGELEVAKQEYSTALRRILRESKVPLGYSFGEKPPDLRNVPQISKGKPFYTKIGYTITISKIDIGTFMTFLKKFYDMNLLHQITQFTLKREDTANLAFDKRQPNKRTDLSVTLAIEAVILDGVPPRKTLFAAPTGTGALMGALGMYSLENNPEVARGITPQEITRVLATPNRIYADVVAHDVFHGYIPAPEKIITPGPPPPPPPPIPLPDLSQFVKFNNLIRTSDGHSLAEIYDVYTDGYYSLDISMAGEKVIVKAQKFAIKSEGRLLEKLHPSENWLDINNPASRGNRKFWVYGLDDNALILGERDTAPAVEAPKVIAKVAKGIKGGAAVVALPVADPKAAIMGGVVAIGPKPERYYIWQFGQTMKNLKELTKAEADPIIRKIQGISPELTKAPEKEPMAEPVKPMAKGVTVVELAPPPREVAPVPVIDPGK